MADYAEEEIKENKADIKRTKKKIEENETEIEKIKKKIEENEADVKKNKTEIERRNDWIENAQAKDDRSERNNSDIDIWRQEIQQREAKEQQLKQEIQQLKQEIQQLKQEIQQLKLENERLKLENEIKELQMKAEKAERERDQVTTRDLRAEIKNKGKLLDETREGHLKLLGKSPASVDHATAALEALVLNQKEPHVNRVIALITSKHKPRTDNHFIPSNFSYKWPDIRFAIDGKSVLETHRPPGPNTPSGHRHVSLTSEALGKLYVMFLLFFLLFVLLVLVSFNKLVFVQVLFILVKASL